MLLQIEQKQFAPGVTVIALAGKLMLGKESEQIEALVPALLEQGQRNIIFDIAGVSRIDSTGIGRFIFSYNKILQAGGTMAITGASSLLRECFRATRLDSVFKLYEDVPGAVAALNATAR